VVASKSIFQFMPQDARDYDKALLWRGIAQTAGYMADTKPVWGGTLSDFLGREASGINVEVYVRPAQPKRGAIENAN
jgi:hypothetical protein